MSYYNFGNKEKKSDVNVTSVNDKARKLLSKERYKNIADINKESVAGGLGLGVAGYIYARSKGKNVLLYTGIATLVGYITFNFIFRKTMLSKLPSQKKEEVKVEEEPKEENFEGKKKVRRNRKADVRHEVRELNGIHGGVPIIRQ